MHVTAVSKNDLTPKKLLEMYRNLMPVVPVEESASGSSASSVGAKQVPTLSFTVVTVRLTKYLMARFHQEKSKPEKYKAFIEQHDEFFQKLSKWNKKQQYWKSPGAIRRIRNCYWGKGLPVEYEMALEGAVLAGECGSGQKAVQAYCDRHLGLDCSGFVRAYFVEKGNMAPSSIIGSSGFWKMTKTLRDSAAEIQVGDCLSWCNSKGSVTATSGATTGHIALVNSAATEKDSVYRFEVCESAGGKGPSHSVYKVLKTFKTKGGATVFQVLRGLTGSKSYVRIYKIEW